MQIFTIEQIMEQLSVSKDTVRRAIKRGDMEALKVGKFWRITEDQFNEYLSKRTFKKAKKIKNVLQLL